MAVERSGGDPAAGAGRIPAVALPLRVHHEDHLALWQVGGGSSVRCDDVPVSLSRDDVLWIPTGTRHTLRVREDSVVFPLFFPVATTRTRLSGVTLARVHAADRQDLLTLFQAQHTIICPRVDLEGRVVRLIETRSGEPAALPMPTSGVAVAVAAAILEDPADLRTLVQWAATVHSSARTLERSFKTETGFTFRQWRAVARMRAASRQLLAGAPVSEVTLRAATTVPPASLGPTAPGPASALASSQLRRPDSAGVLKVRTFAGQGPRRCPREEDTGGRGACLSGGAGHW